MSCEEMRELISAYLDGELDAGERRRVEGHLPGCPACTGELAGLRRAVGLVKGLPRESAPASLAPLIRAALPPIGPAEPTIPPIRSIPAPRSRLLAFPKIAAAVAAGALVGIAIWMIQSDRGIPIPASNRESGLKLAEADKPKAESASAVAEKRDLQVARAELKEVAGKKYHAIPAETRRVVATAPTPAEPVMDIKEESPGKSPEVHGLPEAPAKPAVPKPAPDSALTPPSAPARIADSANAPKTADRTEPPPQAPPVVYSKSRDAPPAGGSAAAATERQAFKGPPIQPSPPAAAAPPPAAQPAGPAPRPAPPPAPETPLIVLTVRAGDPAKEAERTDRLANVVPPGRARSAKAAQDKEGQKPDTRVYDLAPEDAARFIAQMSERWGDRIKIQDQKSLDRYAGGAAKSNVQAALDRLARKSVPEAAAAPPATAPPTLPATPAPATSLATKDGVAAAEAKPFSRSKEKPEGSAPSKDEFPPPPLQRVRIEVRFLPP